MKKNNLIMKNKQYIIYFLALGLVVCGYYGYNGDNSIFTKNEIADIGDAALVSSNDIVRNEINSNTYNTNIMNTNVINKNSQNNIIANNTVTTSTNVSNSNSDYFATSKLERTNMYSQMISTYQDMLNNTNVSDAQKEIAEKEIEKINSTKNSIMICENLISTKGFKNSVVFVNDNSVSAVIEADELKQEDLAQIQNILQRELNVNPQNLHISNKKIN